MELENWPGKNARGRRRNFFNRDDDLRVAARVGDGGVQGDAALSQVSASKLETLFIYSFCFTLTTVIFEKPSSKVGGFNLPAIFRITSSWTTR